MQLPWRGDGGGRRLFSILHASILLPSSSGPIPEYQDEKPRRCTTCAIMPRVDLVDLCKLLVSPASARMHTHRLASVADVPPDTRILCTRAWQRIYSSCTCISRKPSVLELFESLRQDSPLVNGERFINSSLSPSFHRS